MSSLYSVDQGQEYLDAYRSSPVSDKKSFYKFRVDGNKVTINRFSRTLKGYASYALDVIMHLPSYAQAVRQDEKVRAYLKVIAQSSPRVQKAADVVKTVVRGLLSSSEKSKKSNQAAENDLKPLGKMVSDTLTRLQKGSIEDNSLVYEGNTFTFSVHDQELRIDWENGPKTILVTSVVPVFSELVNKDSIATVTTQDRTFFEKALRAFYSKIEGRPQ